MNTKSPELLEVLSEYFNNYLPFGKGLSSNTIRSYQFTFQLLFDYLVEEKRINPGKITFFSLSDDTIPEFLYWLESTRGCSVKTRNQRHSALLSFAKYAMKKNISSGAAFYTEVKNAPKRRTSKSADFRYFTRNEISVLLALPDSRTKIGYRNKVLLSLLYASGARAQEICDLTAGDIHFGNPTSVKLTGKGNKSRVVTIPENCAVLLKNYMTANRMLSTESKSDALQYVFSSQTHPQMSVSCVEEVTKKYVSAAKEQNLAIFTAKSYSPHSFRHSIAVHMLESGIPLPVIKTFLGHESIATTMLYAEVTPELANKYLSEHSRLTESAMANSDTTAYSEKLPFLKKHLART